MPTLDEREVGELYAVRASLEGLMAAEACRRATETDLAGLDDLVERNATLVTFADDAMNAGRPARFVARPG